MESGGSKLRASKPPAVPSAAVDTSQLPSNWTLIRRMIGLGWMFRVACLRVIVLQSLLVLLGLAGLSLTGYGIDVLRHRLTPGDAVPTGPFGWTPPTEWSTFATIAVIAGTVLALACLNALLKFVAAVATADLAQRIVVRLRTDVYDKLQRLSFRFFDDRDSSSIINRVAGDVQAVRSFIDGVLIKTLTVGISLAAYLAYMLSVHVPLTVACLCCSPLLWWGAIWFSRSVRPLYRRSSELGDNLILTLSESVQGIQVIKGFAREPAEQARFEAANQALRNQKYDIFRRLSFYQPLMGFLTQINLLVLIGYGGWLVVQGQLPLGAGLFVFANLLQEFAAQVGQMINIANSVQTSLTGAQRVFEVLDAPVEIASLPQARRLERAQGEIAFEHLSFAYVPGEPVLQDVSFKVRPGECLGIVGETGAGKTTLLSLIARFYDPDAGRVLVDGVDVRELDLQDLRRNIGLVFQESFLFSNTVAANIAFGLPDSNRERIERAARLASAHDFIRDLPEDYESLVGEHGSNLSGGQRQRLAIARALLLDPPLLLFDDATAAVDAETEHEIQQALETSLGGRTTLLVSGRVSVLKHADRILVLERGRIVELGPHAELMARDGAYARLARMQVVEDEPIPAAEGPA